MPATWQPRPDAESLHIISLTYCMAERIRESTADDSHGWTYAEVVYDWWRHEIPRYTDITAFLETVYYCRAFLNTAHPYVVGVGRPRMLFIYIFITLRTATLNHHCGQLRRLKSSATIAFGRCRQKPPRYLLSAEQESSSKHIWAV